MTSNEQKLAASKFAGQWAERGSERSDCQSFWLSLLRDVYGVEHPEEIIEFEKPVQANSTKFIDAYISSTRVLIEQKGRTVNLQQAAKQSDGELLTPFRQAKRYADEMIFDERPRWIITSNFKSFFIHDMNSPHGEPEEVLLKNLPAEYHRLQFIADRNNIHIHREIEVSKEAGRLIGEIYDALLPCYHDQKSSETLRSLNILCVRIVFCLYAEDAGLFGRHGIFHDYLVQFDHQHMRLGTDRTIQDPQHPCQRPRPIYRRNPRGIPIRQWRIIRYRQHRDTTFYSRIGRFTYKSGCRQLRLERNIAHYLWRNIRKYTQPRHSP